MSTVVSSSIDRSPDSFNLSAQSPMRPTDWRWQLIRSGRAIGRSNRDIWLTATREFFNVLRPPGSTAPTGASGRAGSLEDAADWRLFDRCSASLGKMAKQVAAAWALYAAPRQTLRAELEARLLADELTENISKKTLIPIDTVNAYANVFFHVHDRLLSSTWVIQCVLGEEYHINFTERNYGLIWKVYGYFGGASKLDVVIAKTGIRKELSSEEAFEQERRVSLIYKAAIAARGLNVNGHTQLAILDHVHALDIYRSQMGQETPVATGLKALLEDIQIGLAKRGSGPRIVEPSGATDPAVLVGFEGAFRQRIAAPKPTAG